MRKSSNELNLKYLNEAKAYLSTLLEECPNKVDRNSFRSSVLEKCSSLIGGFNYKVYCKRYQVSPIELKNKFVLGKLVESIEKNPLDSCIVLSILSTDDLGELEQKSRGVYYTDYRLACELAESFVPLTKRKTLPKIVDLAAGSGVLLSCIVSAFSKKLSVDEVLSNCIYGADLSVTAIRSARLSLASMTKDLKVIDIMARHLFHLDSLISGLDFWFGIVPDGFDGVIGNPPWEKLKLSQHEFIKSNGYDRHYGQELNTDINLQQLSRSREVLKNYADIVRGLLPGHKGEVDIYMPFIGLSLQILRRGGLIGLIVPASLIRNQSALALRRLIFKKCSSIQFRLFDNRLKYFDIDSRFKFLFFQAKIEPAKNEAIVEFSSGGAPSAESEPVIITSTELAEIRPDLSIPETTRQKEWDIFSHISKKFVPFGRPSSGWDHTFHRELDMSLDKKFFQVSKSKDAIPIVEGRMIHQYRSGIKRYVSGSGRRAIWTEIIPTDFYLQSQFFIEKRKIPRRQQERIQHPRVAFCDITGQTNERTMLSAIVPANCICGNKVPTIDFHETLSRPLLNYLWLGISNSFVFDWLMRRVITTNANFFIVDSIPMPPPDFQNEAIKKIANLAKEIISFNTAPYNWELGLIRARIDAHVALVYGLTYNDFAFILEDFKSIDKAQPSTLKSIESSVTKDLSLLTFLELYGHGASQSEYIELKRRIAEYSKNGGIPYVPTQFTKLSESYDEKWKHPTKIRSLAVL